MARRDVIEMSEREAAPGTWAARRKVLLAFVTFLPVVLMGYVADAFLSTPLDHRVLLTVSSLLVASVGGYVLLDSLTALVRGEQAVQARAVVAPVRRR